MAKVMTTEELKRRKKLQAGISVTTSTLGLAALGMKGGSVAAGRVARSAKAANKAMAGGPAKFSPMAQKAKKFKKISQGLNRASINTSIGAGGIGGVGGYNFASYTRAEGKKKQPVAKAVDWQNISEHERRARDSRRTRERGKSAAGLGVGIATGAPVARELFHPESAPIGHQVRNVVRNVKAGTRVGRTIANNPYGAAALGGVGLAGAGLATMAAGRANERRHDIAIAHQRKKRATASVEKSYGGTMDFGLSGVRQGRNVLLKDEVAKAEEVSKLGSPKAHLQMIASYNPKTGKPDRPQLEVHSKGKSAILRRPKYQVVGAGANIKGHTLIGVSPNRRMRTHAAKEIHNFAQGSHKTGVIHDDQGNSLKMVKKAYDPERNRQKRLDRYATGASVASGTAAFGALHQGTKAVGRKPYTTEKTVKGAVKTVKHAGTGMFAGGKGKVPVRSLKQAGVAAGLGATAAGLAIGSERIRSYKQGKGRSYTPLAQIRMS